MITYVLTNAHKIKIIKCYQKYPIFHVVLQFI